MRWCFLLLIALCSTVSASDIVLVAPPSPVDKNDLVLIEVKGLDSKQINMVRVTSTPSVGVTCKMVMLGGNSHTIFFQTKIPGKYVVRAEMNGWRSGVEAGLVEALKADIDPELIAEIGGLVVKLVDRYPVSSGSAAVDVSGLATPPDAPPVDTNPERIDRATYIYEKDQNNIPRPVSFALQRLNNEYKDVIATEMEEDSTDGDGQVPDQYRIALEAARKAGLPALVIQAKLKVIKVLKDPKSEAEVMDAVLK